MLFLAEIKEDMEMGKSINGLQQTMSPGGTVKQSVTKQLLEEQCEQLCKELQNTRKDAGRPEDLRVRTTDKNDE